MLSNPTIRLYLVRHGETAANASLQLQGSGIDAPLNERGQLQADRLGLKLARLGIGFELVVASDLKRAAQTADHILTHQPATTPPPILLPSLREISWGIHEGSSNPPLNPLQRAWREGDFHAKAEGGESPSQVWERAGEGLAGVLEKAVGIAKELQTHDDVVRVCVVCHGRLLRIMLSAFLHKSLYYMGSFLHRNTSLNIIDLIPHSTPQSTPIPSLSYPTFLTSLAHVVKRQLNNQAQVDTLSTIGTSNPPDQPTKSPPSNARVLQNADEQKSPTVPSVVSMEDGLHKNNSPSTIAADILAKRAKSAPNAKPPTTNSEATKNDVAFDAADLAGERTTDPKNMKVFDSVSMNFEKAHANSSAYFISGTPLRNAGAPATIVANGTTSTTTNDDEKEQEQVTMLAVDYQQGEQRWCLDSHWTAVAKSLNELDHLWMEV